jgi:TolB-like protein
MNVMKKSIAACMLLFAMTVSGFAAEKIPVAIMNFQVTNLNASEVKLMIDFFNNALFETGVFDVIQPEKRDAILREQEFSQSDFADRSKTRNIGKLLSVKLLVFGSVGKLGTNVLFNASCVDVDTGKTVGTFSNKYKSLDEIVDVLPTVSQTFATAAVRTMFV